VLAIEDTTAVSFASYDESRKAGKGTTRRGLGLLNEGSAHGVLAHVMMAVDADSHACLGLTGGRIWNRETTVATPEWKRPLSERESRRWIDAAEQARPLLGQAATVTLVSDREGDMYPLWGRVPALGWHVLTRVRRPSVRPKADTFPPAGTCDLDVPARPGQAKRTARVVMRFGTVDIGRSPNEKDRSLPKSVRLTLIDVREIDPPVDAEAIDWQLLTTHEATSAGKAWEIIGWYRQRWWIEQLFRTVKSQGLGLEDSQLNTAERLSKLTAAALKAACVTLQLVQERDGTHGLAAGTVFNAQEVATVEALVPKLEGKTARQKNPHKPGTLARAAWVIARLGGWNGYYKPPGPITMHRGLQRFHAIHEGRMLV
jgi:hypothetical protein